jgi:glycosyltransferase involved in cell wall biosynthesis
MKTQSLSVLMPVYNAQKYIGFAVESILNQSFMDFEFIIINDGSTDDTLTILQKYAVEDKRIRLISRENKGLVDTLNEGLLLAQTSLIARMDADDIALPTRLQEQHDYLNNHVDVVCVGGASIMIDEAGNELHLLIPPLSNDEIQNNALKGHCPINHPTAMYRLDAIRQVGNYSGDFYPSEDLDLWLRLGEIGKLANLKNPVLKYRFLDNSISGLLAEKQLDAARGACNAAWKRRSIKGVFEAKGEWRASDSKESQYSLILKFGWWAFNYKNKKTALLYGFKAIKLFPFNKEGWRLLCCAILKKT